MMKKTGAKWLKTDKYHKSYALFLCIMYLTYFFVTNITEKYLFVS